MKRYLLFSWDQYDPGGGWHDYQGDFDTIEEAKNGNVIEYGHVVDTQTGEIVSSYNNVCLGKIDGCYRWEKQWVDVQS